MSGHSHWSSIKHQKGVADQKRGKVFSKLSREISVAAKEKGGNPENNPTLRIAVDKAKKFNMPKDNIERAIKKGTGELEGAKLESVTFEAYGPGGIALIIEGITDNRNRTLAEIKQILNQNNGKLANEGSVKWLFERKGCLIINPELQNEKLKNKESLELKAIESGAEDIHWHDNLLDVYTKPEELEKTKKSLEEEEIQVEAASLDWISKEKVKIDEKTEEASEKLFETLDENDAVQEIYSNLKQ
jgi:YebC/PmpR family DNA-binding regulatory protein